MAGSMGIKMPLLLLLVLSTFILFLISPQLVTADYTPPQFPNVTNQSSDKEKREFFSFWKNAATNLRKAHPTMFPYEDGLLLDKFDKLMNQARSLGVPVETPDSFTSIPQLRRTNKAMSTFEQDQTGTSRADRFNPFKVVESTAVPKSTVRRPFFLGPKPSYSSLPHVFQDTIISQTDPVTPVPVDAPAVNPEDEPDVQGQLSNAGMGSLPFVSQAFCRALFQDNYQVYPQRLKIDVENISVGFQDLECERYIERDDSVKVLPLIASLISSDQIRYDISKLFCTWFYRPLTNPTRLPCVEQCTLMRKHIENITAATATPTQMKDRAVLQTFAWPLLLFSGQCEYTPFYDQTNNPEQCTHSQDYTVFKKIADAKVIRPTCEPYPQNGELCSGLLTNYYNDPANQGATALLSSAGPLIKSLYTLAPAYGDSPCLQAFSKQICSRYVMSCTEIPVTMQDLDGNIYAIKYALPQLANRSVCQDYGEKCTPFLGSLSALATSSGADGASLSRALSLLSPGCDDLAPIGAVYECDGQTYTSAYNYYPKSKYYSMDFTVTLANIRTNDFTYDAQFDQSKTISFYPQVTCPPPLVVPDHPLAEGNGRIGASSCATPCPSFLFTTQDYEDVSLMAIILCTVSFAGCLFLIASYILFKEIRQGNYFLQFILCLVIITGAFSIGAYTRYSPNHSIQSQYCVDNSTIATQDDLPGCAVQGFLILFALLAVSAFFASSGFDLFLRIVLQVEIKPHTQQDYLLNLGYSFWGWTIPLLLTTIAAATKSLGPADLGMFYCFVHGRANPTIPWAVAYLPFMVQLFIGCISLSTTIYQLVRVAKRQQLEEYERQAREGGYRASSAPVLRLGNYIVPLVFEFLFFAYISWIVLFRAVVYFLESSWNANGQAFATCLLVEKPIADYLARQQGLAESTKDCGERPKTITLGTWWFHQVFLACVGIATYLVLGSQRIYYQLWAAVIGYYLNIPGLLVWAATTQQAKIYAKRVARARKIRQRKLRLQGKTEQILKERQDQDAEILAQVKEQEKFVKEKEKMQIEEKHRKERERHEQLKAQSLNMIAPHLRPLYLIQQRPRKLLPSLIDIAQNPDGHIGPQLSSVPDIFSVFNVQSDTVGRRAPGPGGQQYYDPDYGDYYGD